METTQTTVETKIQQLGALLNVPVGEIERRDYDGAFIVGNKEYLVLTYDEADAAARDYILDSLWAFNPDFLAPYVDYDGDMDALIDTMRAAQEKLCESFNPIALALVKPRLEDVIRDAICADGRGHFLAGYDLKEIEMGDLFVYRVN
jgi:hypothetical protein